MRLPVEAGASIDIYLQGIAWGRGFEWETTFFDVTPLSYAQLGIMPQMHRTEEETYANVWTLLEAGSRDTPPLANVPNLYLGKGVD